MRSATVVTNPTIEQAIAELQEVRKQWSCLVYTIHGAPPPQYSQQLRDLECKAERLARNLAKVAQERMRERDVAKITRHLVYSSQQAVSWHQIQDCIDDIAALPLEGVDDSE